ncbi:MAG TPA: polyprenyl synthetase family protein [Thermoanaerobaculia bacterium]|nr:polyprenyl synthetase family protein [Thermoanaerobaculia bacterium]
MARSASSTVRQEAVPGEFTGLLDGFRGKLDRELAAWLAAKRRAAAGSREMLELIDGVGELVTQGGKRLRPALVYYTYRACGGPSDEEVLPVALAIELLHTYLLIHDDIMDHAEVRRGHPSAHARFRQTHQSRGFHGDPQDFGRSVAILLGDLAHTWAMELFSGAERSRELTRCFSALSEEVIGGQYLELLVAQRRSAREEELLRVLRLKSGNYTAERPIQLGALLARAPEAVRTPLSRYGTAIGEAFQLQDDLLGMFGDLGTVGKPVGEDLKEGKFTFLIFHALAAASPEQRQVLEAALGRPDLPEHEVARAQRLLEETGARTRVTEMVAERLHIAREAIDGLDLRQDGWLFLSGLVDYLWERES